MKNKDLLIQASINFLDNLTIYYGQVEAGKIWNRISSQLDSDIRESILVAILTDKYNDKICIFGVVENNERKVAAIRALRKYGGFSLRQAIDSYKNLESKISDKLEFVISDVQQKAQVINELRLYGYYV